MNDKFAVLKGLAQHVISAEQDYELPVHTKEAIRDDFSAAASPDVILSLLSAYEEATKLLQEIRSQDALMDWAWDCKEVRRWIKRCDKLIGAPPVQPPTRDEEK